jgi:tyrosyl-DNA phosphodiesterase 2
VKETVCLRRHRAVDEMLFEDRVIPFATMGLLSSARFASCLGSQKEGDMTEGGGKFMLGCVSRLLLSKYRRDALYVGIIPPTAPGTFICLIDMHLDSADSLRDALSYRSQQMERLANLLRESGCSGGIIASDFNAISPEDGGFIS